MSALCIILILLCAFSVIFTGYSAAVTVLNLTVSACATFTSILAADAYSKTSVQQITAAQADKALASMSDNIASFNVYFLDSSCSFTIIGNSSVVYDVHDIPPRMIEGLTGSRILDKGCTLR
eukprot:2049925-Rhodomonas_salina.1